MLNGVKEFFIVLNEKYPAVYKQVPISLWFDSEGVPARDYVANHFPTTYDDVIDEVYERYNKIEDMTAEGSSDSNCTVIDDSVSAVDISIKNNGDKLNKMIEILIEGMDTKQLWYVIFNKMTNPAKRQLIGELLNTILGSDYSTNGNMFNNKSEYMDKR